MTNRAATKAIYATYRPVPSRGVFQIVCEVPIEGAEDALERLGQPGFAGQQVWVAIALLKPDAKEAPAPEKPKREGKPLGPFDTLKPSQQAGILCADPAFWEYLDYTTGFGVSAEDEAANCIRAECEVDSRAELDANDTHTEAWHDIVAEFRRWQTDNRYAGTPAFERERAGSTFNPELVPALADAIGVVSGLKPKGGEDT